MSDMHISYFMIWQLVLYILYYTIYLIPYVLIILYIIHGSGTHTHTFFFTSHIFLSMLLIMLKIKRSVYGKRKKNVSVTHYHICVWSEHSIKVRAIWFYVTTEVNIYVRASRIVDVHSNLNIPDSIVFWKLLSY